MTNLPDGGAGVSPPDDEQARRNAAFTARLVRNRPDRLVASSSPGGAHPLASMQERLWLSSQIDGGVCLDRPVLMRLTGPLDVASLQQALDALIARHDSLRCTFALVGGEIRQTVGEHATLPLSVEDGYDAGMSEQVRGRVIELCAQRVDWAQEPPVAATLLRSSDTDHLLVLAAHHIVIDGWSESIVRRDLAELYRAARDGREPNLPTLPVRFVDWTTWQVARQAASTRSGLTYWIEELQGVADQPPFSMDSVDLAGQPLLTSFQVPPTMVAKLRSIAAAHDTTLFTVLLAALDVAVAAHTGLDDVVIGTPVSGRNDSQLDEVVGCFINVLPFRCRIGSGDSFIDLLGRVRTTVMNGLSHQDVALARIESALGRQAHRRPLIRTRFQLRNFPGDEAILGHPYFADPGPFLPSHDATVNLHAIEQPLGGLIIEVTARGDEAAHQGASLIRSQVAVLAAVASDPASTVVRLVEAARVGPDLRPDPTIVLSSQEWHPGSLVTDRFDDLARSAPDRVAVRWGDEQLTYGQLDRVRRGIAAKLLDAGLRRHDIVATIGTRSPGLVAALLGVLSAGGVICPIDPDLPDEVISRYVRESGASTTIDLAGRTPSPTMTVDPFAVHDHQHAYDRQLPRIEPDDPAYVFFTSGSTGTPKAVLGKHGSLAQFLEWQRSAMSLDDSDVVAFMSAVTFDPMLRNIFLPLSVGASVTIPPTPLLPADALTWLAGSGATLVNVTPSLADCWLSMGPERVVGGALRWVTFGGEMLDGALVDRWRATLDRPGRVVNVYGPTETTLIRCASPVAEVPDPGAQHVGWAIPGSQALVLDDAGALCDPGRRGEVLLRTAFGTYGYLNAAEEQQLRFVANPLNTDPADIVYRTGDVGCYLPDGSLMLAGRGDDQVKIMGVRVEPADVMSHLSRHPGVERAVVLGERSASGAQILAAYVVVRDRALGASELRRWLATKLPAALVPAKIVPVEDLSLNVNGKLDRQALNRMSADDQRATKDDAGPADPDVETIVQTIWTDVLRLDDVTPTSDFFELGGHSLLAIQLFHHLEHRFGVQLDLHTIFEHPTPRQLADLVRSRSTDGVVRSGQLASVAPDRALEERFPLSPVQEVLWWLARLDPELSGSPVLGGSRLRGPLDLDALARAIDRLVERHHTLRARLAPDDPQMTVDPPGPATVLLFDYSNGGRVDSEEARRRIAEDQWRRLYDEHLDLQHGPVTRFVILRFAADDHALLFATHHQFTDGTSAPIRRRDLSELYRAEVERRAPVLPELQITFGEYARIQSERRDVGGFDDQVTYWMRRLGGSLPTLELPGAGPRPPTLTSRTHLARRYLDVEFVGLIEGAAAELGTTPMRVTLAAYATFLHRLTGQSDIMIGFPVADRTVAGTEHLIGMFANRSALRFRFNAGDTFTDVLREADSGVSDATRHRSVPFEQVVQRLRVPADSSRSAVFQTMFQWRRRGQGEYDFPGVASTVIGALRDSSVYDIAVEITRDQGGDGTLALTLNASLYSEADPDRFIDPFLELLTALITRPGEPLSTFPVAVASTRADEPPPAQHEDVAIGSKADDVPVEATHRIIRRWARQRPHATAIEDDRSTITYSALDELADRIAATLNEQGVRRGDLVGVAMVQSPLLVAALIGIHRLGAGYLHLDQTMPAARLQFLLDDAQPRVVVTADDGWAGALDRQRWRMVDLSGPLSSACVDDLATIEPGAPAYVIYTSGTTGSPKGVLITQGALASFVHAASQRYGVATGDRLLQFHSPSFDSSVEEIFVGLCSGATLVVRGAQTLGSARLFVEEVAERAITVLDLPTSFWHALVRDLHTGRITWPPCVRTVIIGGEAALPELVNKWNTAVGGTCRLLNSYGPTETTVVALSADLTGRTIGQGRPVPIGRPLAGTIAAVLDADGTPVPEGTVGELLLGGPSLAVGYLGSTSLTTERFVDVAGFGRMYRTGDRVCVEPDGEFVFHGRIDNQVKIRGFRVELGEVEELLRRMDPIVDAVVLAERRHDTTLLVAHAIVSSPSQPEELLARARVTLPHHLVPSRLVVHRDFPRTTGGKPDRNALRTGEESVSAFAPEASEVPVALPLSPYQMGLWMSAQTERTDRTGLSPQTNLLTAAYRLRGPLDTLALDRALTEVVSRHDALRVRFDRDGAVPRQLIDPVVDVRFRFVDLSLSPAGERERLAAEAAARSWSEPIDLEHDHPWRALLVRVGADDHLMVLVFHHIAVDGISLNLIRRELAASYAAWTRGVAPQLDAPVVRYATIVEELHHHTMTPEHDVERRWWAARLAGARPVPQFIAQGLPGLVHGHRSDEPADDRRDDRSQAQLVIELPDHVAQAWRTLARRLRTTPFVVGLALTAAALYELGGDDDLVVGTPLSDRDRPGSEQLVGMFVNLTPLRVQVERSASFVDLVAHCRSVVMEALDHRGVPFAELVRSLHPTRAPGRNPLLEVTFQIVDRAIADLALDGLVVTQADGGSRAPQVAAAITAELGQGAARLVLRRNPELLSSGAAQQLGSTVERLARTFVQSPDAKLGAGQRGPVSAMADAVRRSGTSGGNGSTLEIISGVLAELLEVDRIGPDDDFFDFGGHSLLAIRLLSDLEDLFGVSLRLADVLQRPTARGLAGLVTLEDAASTNRSSGSGPSDLLVELNGSGTQPALYCIHPAGGDVAVYERLSRHLGDAVPVIGVRERGLNGTAPTAVSIADMARDYLAEIGRTGEAPRLLAGYSTGGLVAYEMACQLEESGVAPALVVLFDTIYRFGSERKPVARTARSFVRRARAGGIDALTTRFWERVAMSATSRVNRRSWDAAVKSGRPADPHLSERMSISRNSALAPTFPARPYRGRVLYVRATGVPADGSPTRGTMPVENWIRLCSGPFEILNASGGHEGRLSLLSEPFVESLAGNLRSRLLDALASQVS